jgi:hypothetical protein
MLLFSSTAFADPAVGYEITITNVTKGQTFTPSLIAIHDRSIAVFAPGSAAGLPLEILAEAGDTQPLTDALLNEPDHVATIQTIPGLLGPGETTSIMVEGSRFHRYLTVAAMLIPTNDTFYALNAAPLPLHGQKTRFVRAYDAGTEANDQACANIPGPRCGGEGHSAGPNPDDEGFVYVSNGFHDLGTDDGNGGEVLTPAPYDWRNPVARITVRRLR